MNGHAPETGSPVVPGLGSGTATGYEPGGAGGANIRLILFFALLPLLVAFLLHMMYRPEPAHVQPPKEVNFCQQINAELAKTGSGGQIAPVCGNTPYPFADQLQDP